MALKGPLVVGISGFSLTEPEMTILQHPLISGVILFSRNFQSPEQLAALTKSIHDLREPKLLITVDQEGGRVQRFRSPFSVLPAAGKIGKLYDQDPGEGLKMAKAVGQLMAMELRACGVDLSFAPVLDIDNGQSKVIGDRGFHADPKVVALLAQAFVDGMALSGMKAVGKHYPGHGSVINDTHLESAIDPRPLFKIEVQDLLPFSELANANIAAFMAAHVIYPSVDSYPAGFSKVWLKEILRHKLGYNGIIFSDDLGMMAAKKYGDIVETVKAALQAGCDRVLLCNEPEAVRVVLAKLEDSYSSLPNDILEPDHANVYTWQNLPHQPDWQYLTSKIATFLQD